MFQRIGAAALKHDLSNTIKLCESLGNPQDRIRTLHIAGTNGKGSTSHMLASILQEAGYKTGLYTSPHLKHFTERIRIDGVEISQRFVLDFVNRMQPHIERISPSFFELTVAMAFDYFVYGGVEVAVIETGLGGRLDSTNIITPILSIITNIGWDHKDILGDTLEKIASEKAGIIKPHVPVVVSERQPIIDEIFIEKSGALDATITFAQANYGVEGNPTSEGLSLRIVSDNKIFADNLILPLQGFYQTKNVVGVMQAVEILNAKGWHISQGAIVSGLERVVINTSLKGRWQVLSVQPLKVCDTAHNVDGITEVLKQIRAQHYRRLFVVLGMVKDKDVTGVLELLPKEGVYYFCQSKIPRAMEVTLLATIAKDVGLSGDVVPDVNDAIRKAEKAANDDDMIFIGGSTFVVAEIENL